jgi:two-component system, NtrC family, sensor kinase
MAPNAADQTVQPQVALTSDKQIDPLLQTFFDRNPLAAIYWNTAFEVLEWNRTAEKIFGYPRAEAVGHHATALILPEITRSHVEQLFQSVLMQAEGDHRINQNITKEGRIITCEWSNTPLIVDGKVIGVLSTAQDISDRIALEETLRDSETRWKNLFENTSNALWIYDLEQSAFVDCNQAAADLLGYAHRAELIGLTLSDFAPTLQPDGTFSIDKAATMFAEASQCGKNRFEWMCLRCTGELIWIEVVLTSMTLNGKSVLHGVWRDIRDRKIAEQALKENETKYRHLVEMSQDFIWSVDAEGYYTFVNRAVKTIFGYEPEEMLGHHFTDFETPEQIQKDLEIFQRILQGESMFRYESKHLTKDGELIYLMFNAIVLRDEVGNLLGTTGTASNVSDRKQAELKLRQQASELEHTLEELQRTQAQVLQSEKMSSLGQLVAGVAHEINNPVSFIYGNLDPASDYIQDLLHLVHLYQTYHPNHHPQIQSAMAAMDLDFVIEDLPKLLDSLRMGADRIQKIVLSLRNFSRMDEAEIKAVNLHEGIDNTLMILEHRLKAQPDREAIQVIRDYGTLPLIECYAGQLNQVFMNLLGNAIDALEEGQQTEAKQSAFIPTITITTQTTDRDCVNIIISDNGSGIPAYVQKRLFDPFFTTKPVGKGTGMGLSISYQIITEKHHGTLKCVSSPGNGAQFVIEIPICLSCHTEP